MIATKVRPLGKPEPLRVCTSSGFWVSGFVEEGPVGEVLSRPRHPYTRALLEANPAPDPDQEIARPQLSGEVPSLLRRPRGCELHGRCPLAEERCRQACSAGGDRVLASG